MALTYSGDDVDGISGIAASIYSLHSSGEAPYGLQCSGHLTTATGATKPYDQLHYEWDFGDTDAASVAANAMTHPVTGDPMDPNTDQSGPEASYIYRTPGSYTVTLTVTARDTSGTITDTDTTTLAVTVSAWSGTDMYFDSVGGLDANAGTIGAPRQTAAAIEAWLEGGVGRRALLKCGSSFTSSSLIRLRSTGRKWIEPYDTGAKPIINLSSSISIDGTDNNMSDMVIRGVELEGNGNNVTLLQVLGSSVAAGASPALRNVRIIDVDFKQTGGTSTVTSNMVNFGFNRIQDVCLWGCTWDGGNIDAYTLLIKTDGTDTTPTPMLFQSVVGCSFQGCEALGAGLTLDHYIYSTGYREHTLIRWNDFGVTDGLNFCLNMNCTDAGVDTNYVLVDGCNLSGTINGMDWSNAGNDPADGQFDNVIVQNCGVHVGQIGTQGWGIYGTCILRIVVRDNKFWANPDGDINILDPEVDYNFYRNRSWTDFGTDTGRQVGFFVSGQGGRFLHNQIHSLGTGTGNIIWEIPIADAANYTFAGNQYYSPEFIDAAEVKPFKQAGGPRMTMTEWTDDYFNDDILYGDPGWLDPANGDFSTETGESGLYRSNGISIGMGLGF
jgi:PKD repeat protein